MLIILGPWSVLFSVSKMTLVMEPLFFFALPYVCFHIITPISRLLEELKRKWLHEYNLQNQKSQIKAWKECQNVEKISNNDSFFNELECERYPFYCPIRTKIKIAIS